MKALYGDQNPSSASDVIEGRLIHIGLRVLELKSNVVIDFGLWVAMNAPRCGRPLPIGAPVWRCTTSR